MFLIDSSSGVDDKRQRYLELAADLVSVLEIGEFGAQVIFFLIKKKNLIYFRLRWFAIQDVVALIQFLSLKSIKMKQN